MYKLVPGRNASSAREEPGVTIADAVPVHSVCILLSTQGERESPTPQVSTQDMRHIVDEGGAVVIDSRPRSQFSSGYIPGAICLDVTPEEQVAAVRRVVAGDMSRSIVIYCNGPHCKQSRRLGKELALAGFTGVRRYQLGISVWRALGGPTAVDPSWIRNVAANDRTAILLDVRSSAEFRAGSLPQAASAPLEDVVSGALEKFGMPSDDFNRRVILFGRDAAQARKLAEFVRNRPWANVSYADCTFADLVMALQPRGDGN